MRFLGIIVRREGLVGERGVSLGRRVGRVAKGLGPGHTVVTVLADGGSRYPSKLFNPEFLRGRNPPVPGRLRSEAPDGCYICTTDVISKVWPFGFSPIRTVWSSGK